MLSARARELLDEADVEREAVRLDLLVEAEVGDAATVTVPSSPPCVAQVDPRLMRVAARNLVANARAHGRTEDAALVIDVTSTSVSVRDAGPGFPSEILALARGPFSSAPSTGGSGVGLSTCAMIARLHGGALRLDNPPEGGARATLTLA